MVESHLWDRVAPDGGLVNHLSQNFIITAYHRRKHMATAIITRTYENHEIGYNAEGWFNATDAAKKFDKRPNDWLELPSTKSYIKALCEKENAQQGDYIYASKARGQAGTWIHPKLVLHFAIWLNSKTLIEVAEKISSMHEIIQAINDFEVPGDCPDLYVYAIRNATTGNIKLGISRDPKERLKQLQTGNDCPLELVAYKKAENRFEDEVSIHRHASANHVRGEWFDENVSKLLIDQGLAESANPVQSESVYGKLLSQWLVLQNQEEK